MGCCRKCRQRWRERRGTETAKTVYPADFEEKVLLFEATRENTIKLADMIDNHLLGYGKLHGTTTNHSDQLGAAAASFGPTLSTSHPQLSACLNDWGTAERNVANLERNYQKQVKVEVVMQLRNWAKQEFTKFQKSLKMLRKLRLYMDAAQHKANTKGELQKYKDKYERKKAVHNDFFDKFQQEHIARLKDMLSYHMQLYERFITIRRNFLNECAAEFGRTMKSIRSLRQQLVAPTLTPASPLSLPINKKQSPISQSSPQEPQKEPVDGAEGPLISGQKKKRESEKSERRKKSRKKESKPVKQPSQPLSHSPLYDSVTPKESASTMKQPPSGLSDVSDRQ